MPIETRFLRLESNTFTNSSYVLYETFTFCGHDINEPGVREYFMSQGAQFQTEGDRERMYGTFTVTRQGLEAAIAPPTDDVQDAEEQVAPVRAAGLTTQEAITEPPADPDSIYSSRSGFGAGLRGAFG